MAEASVMEKIVSLCKRRGFVYPASEIYGGLNGFWDYGPLGVLLKNNIRDSWWRNMVEAPPIGPDGHPVEIVGLDSSIIQNPKTWVASGHVGGFSDPMVDDRETKQRYRADHLVCALATVRRKGGDVQEIGWLAVLSGDDAVTLPLIALGGDGIVSVASNEIPDLMSQMTSLALAGKWDEARELHYRILPLMEVILKWL